MARLEVIRALAARLPPEVPRRGPNEETIRERSLFRVVSPYGQRLPEISDGGIDRRQNFIIPRKEDPAVPGNGGEATLHLEVRYASILPSPLYKCSIALI